MNAIHIISKNADTVTVSREDYERMVEALEDAEDIEALRSAEAHEKEVGKEAAYADYLPIELVERMILGEHPVRVWREHRGVTAQTLADKSGVSRSYIIEIEGGKKPGSVAAYRQLAEALGVKVDDLLPEEHKPR